MTGLTADSPLAVGADVRAGLTRSTQSRVRSTTYLSQWADNSSAIPAEGQVFSSLKWSFYSPWRSFSGCFKRGARSVYAPEMAEMKWYNSALDRLIAP